MARDGGEAHAEPTEDAKIDLGVREMARFLKSLFLAGRFKSVAFYAITYRYQCLIVLRIF